jgi:hypothetical protein
VCVDASGIVAARVELSLDLDLLSRVDAASAFIPALHVALTIGVVLSLSGARLGGLVLAGAYPRPVTPVPALLSTPIRSLAALSLVRERGRGGKRSK